MEDGFTNFLIPNTDVLFAPHFDKKMLAYVDDAGIVSAHAVNDLLEFKTMVNNPDRQAQVGVNSIQNVVNDDQSFSLFMISLEAYENIGEFDEDFVPAYFEDSDYLYRAKINGWKPVKAPTFFYHFLQGTVKNTDQTGQQEYFGYLKDLAELYKRKWGGLPGNEMYNIAYDGNKKTKKTKKE
jgi:GT2 family glycosyltransferase